MEGLLIEYLPILLFIGIAGGLSLVLMLVPFVIAPSKPDLKSSPPMSAASPRSAMHA